jgi:hypothetical protein
MKKLLFVLALVATFAASGADFKLSSLFGPGVTNVAFWGVDAVGSRTNSFAGQKIWFTQMGTNNLDYVTNGIVYHTSDGAIRYPLSLTNILATRLYIDTTTNRTEWTNVVVGSIANGYPFAPANMVPLLDGGVSPGAFYATVCGTNALAVGTVAFELVGSTDGKYYCNQGAPHFTTTAITCTGVTPVTLITNLPSTWQCMKYIAIRSILVGTNAPGAGWTYIPAMGISQAVP